jgi:hypothetical protein
LAPYPFLVSLSSGKIHESKRGLAVKPPELFDSLPKRFTAGDFSAKNQVLNGARSLPIFLKCPVSVEIAISDFGWKSVRKTTLAHGINISGSQDLTVATPFQLRQTIPILL